MKHSLGVLFILWLLWLPGCSASKPGDTSNSKKDSVKKLTFETERQKESYSVGYRTGMKLKELVKNNEIDLDVTILAILDAVHEKPQLREEDIKRNFAIFNKRVKKRQEEQRKAQAYRNQALGEQFLRDNAKREGVVVTESGLQYKLIEEGTGPRPTEEDIAIVHYKGNLVNGMEIFNTYKKGEPIKLPVIRSLPAWKEALQLMKTGSKFVLFIPPKLAYKDHGKPPLVPPNMVLVYEAHLIGIE